MANGQPRVDPALAAGNQRSAAGYAVTHFGWKVADGVVLGAGGNFCSGGDVHEISGPLVRLGPARAVLPRFEGN